VSTVFLSYTLVKAFKGSTHFNLQYQALGTPPTAPMPQKPPVKPFEFKRGAGCVLFCIALCLGYVSARTVECRYPGFLFCYLICSFGCHPLIDLYSHAEDVFYFL
jgi:hypothetical protein